MAESFSKRTDITVVAETPPNPGHPQEQFEVGEASTTADNSEENIVYPSGLKLGLILLSILITVALVGLDITIIAPVVPSLTNHFKTVEDIGWYSAAYALTGSACIFTFGKFYTIFAVKHLFISCICIFEVGSLLCTLAQTSKMFITGRAVAGVGSAGIGSGALIIVSHTFPTSKRPMWTSVVGLAQTLAMISSPIIGGALIDSISWRACFGINIPLGVLVVILIFFCFQEPPAGPDVSLPFNEKMKQIDFLGMCFMIPSVCCLLLALQWGGIRFGWGDARIIVLFIVFAIMFAAFGWRQHKQGDKAILPPRILKNRSVIAGAWFVACLNGVLAVTEYYMSIYFQGVKGYTAVKSGTLILPMLVGLMAASSLAGVGTTMIGYCAPFMVATTILTPIAAGILTTIDVDENLVKVLCCLGFLGAAIGVSIGGPFNAVQTSLPLKDIPIGLAVTGFGGGMGSAIFIVVSSTLFQNRLTDEIHQLSPGTNVTLLEHAGLSEIRNVVGMDRLKDVVFGYDKAVTQTLYLPVALSVATIVGSSLVEWRSIKKKQT